MNSAKMAIKWTRIDLQTSVIPIWKPENKGYKIGFEKRCWGQQEWPENSLENFQILFADSVYLNSKMLWIATVINPYVSFH